MHFLKSFVVFLLCGCIQDSSTRNYPFHRNLWTSITPRGKFQDFHNVTIYLGYSNNPFGVSTPSVPYNKQGLLTQEVLRSRQPPHSETPLFSDLKPPSDNKIDSQFNTPQEQRSKRGVIHLYNMVSCATGCNPLIYKGYGCYCGFLGSGYAVDGIDRCCKNHDWCYDRANCPMFLEYFVPYYWKCFDNRPYCAIPPDQIGGPGSCAQRLCECDKLLSECLSKYPCPSKRAVCRSSPWRLIQNAFMGF
ncbi:phospholipase A2 A2-actitoxin-Ucs2a [Zophobas morio]|uniref:phospholipase A2 A2-actitoxin-Ucs2a n=1 Tax=Zophobas morio TaxID=2755281 RepID=UPI003083152C